MPDTRPYGSWSSPVTSELLVTQAVRLGDVVVAGDEIWWTEGRAAEGGRQVLVSCAAGASPQDRPTEPEDRLMAGFSARTAVHEYGGSSYAVLPAGEASTGGSTAVFANWDDQRLYVVRRTGLPTAVTATPEVPGGDRYGDLSVVPGGQWLLAVRERHAADGGAAAVVNDVVAIRLPAADGGGDATVEVLGGGDATVKVIAAGHDFYSAPRSSPDGSRIAWVSWDHPSMPWDSTELWTTALSDGVVTDVGKVAGGPGESVTQPGWSPDGRLHYISDRSGWWNLYDEAGTALAPLDAEFSGPDWQLGQSTYTFLPDGRLVAVWSSPGGSRLGVVADGAAHPVELPYTAFSSLRTAGSCVVAVAGSPTADPAVILVDVDTASTKVLRRSRVAAIDPSWLSRPEPVEYPTAGGRRAHALWYPPTSPQTAGPEGELPPLMVVIHGGPTASASPVLSYGVQYWTSRGFGVVDVDYGGSTGYGRAYRQRLRGRWGIVDIDDCVAAAEWLADRGLVDRRRMVIRGGSAGGYTTLAALTFRDVFAAGASHYGVADLELLARDTHKFEARYLDGLIGPYPEAVDVYHERSPLHHVEGLDRPLILFQGSEDAIVPPAQAELIAAALADRGVPVAHLTFAGEQHGFRQASTIRRVIDTELAFYGRVLGFTPVDRVEPFEIVNEGSLPVH